MMATFSNRPLSEKRSTAFNRGIYQQTSKAIQDKKNAFGISINLYRLAKAEKLEDIKDLEGQLAKTADTKVNLYKITGDIAMIFLNTTDPFSNPTTIPYKMLYGKRAKKSVSVGDVGGFLATTEIPEITQWIKKNKIETFEGFSKVYDNLSKEVKKELEEMGTEDKADLFTGYVRPMVVLYFTALENNNSVVFIGQ
ncbi:hypothetical protein SAE01_20330 [Segetibacter aerophilus]|uniref:Uncharacterized protein n=2 Tax=Segetibacter aerophilus TaxID=670293 RepID=A0A512BCG0_9BACT|nr:hypothetical protein SAE01_20330 [Segetibacter aerophilus]